MRFSWSASLILDDAIVLGRVDQLAPAKFRAFRFSADLTAEPAIVGEFDTEQLAREELERAVMEGL